MSKTRIRRIKRLMALREKHLDAETGKLTLAHHSVERARDAQLQADAHWQQRCDTLVEPSRQRVDELASSSAYIVTLRQTADRAAQQVVEAEQDEAEQRKAVIDAEREVKRLERWSDQVTELVRVKRDKREQGENDELAARMTATQETR